MADQPLNILSLCTGGGGLDLGVELALPGSRVVCGVEWDTFAVEYLASLMEAQCVAPFPVWSNLKTFDGAAWRGCVDILTAGYPCQPFSLAGKRGGTDDPRHLWPDVARVIREAAPAIVFLENVSGHLSLGGREVIQELQGMGYRTTGGLFAASEVGAPHKRERLFIMANARSIQLEQHGELNGWAKTGAAYGDSRGKHTCGRDTTVDDTTGPRPDRTRSRTAAMQQSGQCLSREGCATLDNSKRANTRQREQREQREARGGRCGPPDAGGFMGNTECNGLRKRQRPPAEIVDERLPIFPPGPGNLERWRQILEIDPSLEPALCGMAHGLADRRHWLRLLGNGVCPLQAAHAFCALWADLT